MSKRPEPPQLAPFKRQEEAALLWAPFRCLSSSSKDVSSPPTKERQCVYSHNQSDSSCQWLKWEYENFMKLYKCKVDRTSDKTHSWLDTNEFCLCSLTWFGTTSCIWHKFCLWWWQWMLFIILKLMTVGQDLYVHLVASPSASAHFSTPVITLLPSANFKSKLQCLSLTNEITRNSSLKAPNQWSTTFFSLLIPSYIIFATLVSPWSSHICGFEWNSSATDWMKPLFQVFMSTSKWIVIFKMCAIFRHAYLSTTV